MNKKPYQLLLDGNTVTIPVLNDNTGGPGSDWREDHSNSIRQWARKHDVVLGELIGGFAFIVKKIPEHIEWTMGREKTGLLINPNIGTEVIGAVAEFRENDNGGKLYKLTPCL